MIRSVRFRATVSRCFGVHAEAVILVAVLLAWQAARIPLEGSVDASLAHARTWHDLEGALGLVGLENAIVSAVYDPDVIHVARWGYSNLHLFAIVAFMLVIRIRAPDRYPPLRNAFVLLHLPALVVIGLWRLASPSWLPHPPEWPGDPPTDAELTGSLEATLRNSTAAAVSEHFGHTVLILAAALWIAPRAPLAWLLALYPPLVLCIIVGTGRHWVLDAIVGTLTVAVGSVAAWWLHRSRAPLPLPSRAAGPRDRARRRLRACHRLRRRTVVHAGVAHAPVAGLDRHPLLIVLATLVARRR
jgi:hypothetical protein